MITLSSADITNKEKNAIKRVLTRGRLALGPELRTFEQKFAKYIGTKYALAVNSGTSGLHLLIKTLGIKEGDEVITTPFSFIASANCILFERANPVFVDIDPKTLNIDPQKIEKAITKKTKAMVIVDIFGHPVDWSPILKIAKKYKLKVIEDSCEALGSKYKNKKCGNFGDAGVFAFYPNKQMTTGEGGIIVTDQEKIIDHCRALHNQGRKIKNGQWLEHHYLGYNYRMSELQAALGVAQISRIDEIVKKRKRVAKLYTKKLKGLKSIILPYQAEWADNSWFVYVIRLSKNYTRKDRDTILKKLNNSGIQCSNYFQCIHLQPFYKKKFGYKKGCFPVAEDISNRTIALPFHNNLTEKEINYVVKNLIQHLTKK